MERVDVYESASEKSVLRLVWERGVGLRHRRRSIVGGGGGERDR